jgi:hypothetical protein
MSVDFERTVGFVRAHGGELDRAWVRASAVFGLPLPPVAGCTPVSDDGLLPQKQVSCLRNNSARGGGTDGEVLGSGDVLVLDGRSAGRV